MDIVKHIKIWNKWRKGCLNSKSYKIGVLVELINSPTLSLLKQLEGIKEL